MLCLLLTTVLAWARPRHDLMLENLLLRHQLAVLTRPTRSRLRPPLHTWDKLVWVLARRRCAGWREHLAFVTPETVVHCIGRVGACSGVGSPIPQAAVRISAPKYGTHQDHVPREPSVAY